HRSLPSPPALGGRALPRSTAAVGARRPRRQRTATAGRRANIVDRERFGPLRSSPAPGVVAPPRARTARRSREAPRASKARLDGGVQRLTEAQKQGLAEFIGDGGVRTGGRARRSIDLVYCPFFALEDLA